MVFYNCQSLLVQEVVAVGDAVVAILVVISTIHSLSSNTHNTTATREAVMIYCFQRMTSAAPKAESKLQEITSSGIGQHRMNHDTTSFEKDSQTLKSKEDYPFLILLKVPIIMWSSSIWIIVTLKLRGTPRNMH
uniref:Uncharacterized protein n=1 Tax=Glossina brevipalpis TaxID=37001 RepID=A0A1A9WBC4_9MUSC